MKCYYLDIRDTKFIPLIPQYFSTKESALILAINYIMHDIQNYEIMYYEDNKNNFLLKENITRCIYAKFYSNTQDLKKLKQWMVSSVEADREKVDNFCLQYAFDYFLNDDTWLSFADLMQRTGIKTYNQEQFLQSTKVIEVPDSGSVTIVRFYDFKIKESLSPLSFENNNIRNLIINKRKLDLITKLENAAYDNALKKNEFEIFKK